MKQYTHTLVYTLLIFTILLAPTLFVYAADIIPCKDDCTFAKLFELVANVIDFLLFKLAVPLAAIAFAWAGTLMVIYGNNESERKKAKSIILAAIVGLAFALAAWLIVNTIFSTLTSIELS